MLYTNTRTLLRKRSVDMADYNPFSEGRPKRNSSVQRDLMRALLRRARAGTTTAAPSPPPPATAPPVAPAAPSAPQTGQMGGGSTGRSGGGY